MAELIRSDDADDERHVPLEGVFNFRDLGGYRAADGRFVRWRRLFRADGLHRLAEAGVSDLEVLGIRTVLDLRTPRELERRGRVPSEEVTYHHVPLMLETWAPEIVPEDPDDEWIAEHYADLLTESPERFAAALRLLADDARYPAVFHCTAGKDRTGVLAAVVLDLLDVVDDDIVADYALSRQATQRWLAWFEAEYPDREIDPAAHAMLESRPETMRRFLELVRARFGSVRGYVAGLDVASETPERLAALLLETPPA